MAYPIKKFIRKNGTTGYRFVIDAGTDKNGKRKQLTCTFETKKEAEAEHAKLRHKRKTGTLVIPDKVTVDELLDLYLETVRPDVEASTFRNYRDAFRPARERLGHLRVQHLEEEDVRNMAVWMATGGRKVGGKPGTGLGARSIGLTLGRLRAALAMAVVRGVAERNVAEHVKVPKAARKASKQRRLAREKPWNEAEVRAFLTAIRDERLFPVMLLSMLGLRPQEVCGLRWASVDLDEGWLSIDNVRTLVAGEVVEKETKTEAGERELPLPAPATAGLARLKERQKRESRQAGEAYARSGYVLVDELGRPWKTDKLRREAVKLMKKAGVRVVRLYDARHACLTFLATSGVPDVVVSAWAGHADLAFTKRTYIHPDREHLRQAADHLADLLDPAGGAQ